MQINETTSPLSQSLSDATQMLLNDSRYTNTANHHLQCETKTRVSQSLSAKSWQILVDTSGPYLIGKESC